MVPDKHRQIVVDGVEAFEVDLVAVGIVHQLDVAQQHEMGILVFNELLVEGERKFTFIVDCKVASKTIVFV
jgi:hypothetical protein